MQVIAEKSIMDELVQDLASALDDPSLKHDVDEPGDLSGSDMKIDRDGRKRKMRKRRTTNSNGISGANNTVLSQVNNSPRSSSSLDETTKDNRYIESFTANCSEESDEYALSHQSTLKRGVLPARINDRVHHKRVFKQARPCYCESDSHTENAPVLPRKHRKKKPRRMAIDNELLADTQDSAAPAADDEAKSGRIEKKLPYPSNSLSNSNIKSKSTAMNCEATKTKLENKRPIACLQCHRKSCDRLVPRNIIIGISNEVTNEKCHNGSMNLPEYNGHICQCNCHLTLGKDESSLSGSSSNSDTDSANYTLDDIGGDGDDEMTDFYAEADGGPVLGIPHIPVQYCELNEIELPFLHDQKLKRFVVGDSNSSESSRRGFHARHNRLPGMAARLVRRGRRRPKMKKAKEKVLREQDLSSLSKLSVSAKNKRIRLDGFRDCGSNRQDWSSQRAFSLQSPEILITKSLETNHKEDMDVLEESSECRNKPATTNFSNHS